MALWPFKKRAKTNSGEKIGVGSQEDGDARLINNKQQGRSGTVKYPAPLATNIDRPQFVGTPQKQLHHSGYSSYFHEHSDTNSDSSISSQLPHKPNMSKRAGTSRRPKTAEDAYITPPTSEAEDNSTKHRTKFGRFSSKRSRGREKPNRIGEKRPNSIRDTPLSPRPRPAHSTLSLNNALKPLKPEIKRLEVLAPRPKLRFGYESSGNFVGKKAESSLVKFTMPGGEANSRRVPGELPLVGPRVDDLADELDAKGLREILERDRRRRERKKLAEHERIQRRMEDRLAKQKFAQQEMESEREDYISEISFAGPSNPRQILSQQNNSRTLITPVSVDTQSPVSWLRDPSVEELQTGDAQFSSRKSSPTRGNQSQQALTDSALSDYPTQLAHGPSPNENLQNHCYNDSSEHSIPHFIADSEHQQGRARWTSFLKKATASRIRKEQAIRRLLIGQSAFLSDSEGEMDDASRITKSLSLEELRQDPNHPSNNEVQASEAGQSLDRPFRQYDGYRQSPGSRSAAVSIATIQRDESPRSESYITPQSPQKYTSIPLSTAGNASRYLRHTPSPQFTHRSAPDCRNIASRASRYSSRAVSPDSPVVALSQSLASIDSEGSWLSGKLDQQSLTHLSPLRTSANSLRQRFRELESEEESGGGAEADDYFGRVEPLNERPFLLEEEEEDYNGNADRNEDSVLNLSDEDTSADEAPVPESERWGDCIVKSPEIHESLWRADSREGVLRFDGDESPSPTAATAGYNSSVATPSNYVTPLEHPFAQVGENFVTPLEHFSQRRPPYRGAPASD